MAEDLVSTDAALASVLQQVDSTASVKKEQRTTLKAFLDGKDVFVLVLTGFSKSLIYLLIPLVVKKTCLQ